jgi:hypothetical protein
LNKSSWMQESPPILWPLVRLFPGHLTVAFYEEDMSPFPPRYFHNLRFWYLWANVMYSEPLIIIFASSTEIAEPWDFSCVCGLPLYWADDFSSF